MQYFSEHYHEPFTIPDLSRQLGIALLHIETAFDRCKGKTTNQALLAYRLNRLCDQMGHDPSADINTQISQCGLNAEANHALASFSQTNHQFINCFGIDLIEYHQQCFLAEAARQQHQDSQYEQQPDEVVADTPHINLLLTRFHRSS